MPTTLIIVAAVAILIILLATASYKVCPADRVMVITGPGGRRFVSGGSAFIIPFIMRVDWLSLGAVQSLLRTDTPIPTKDAILIDVNAVANFQIASETMTVDENGKQVKALENAAKNYLNQSKERMEKDVTQVLLGKLREVIGKTELKELMENRDTFAATVAESARVDMERLGLQLTTFNIQDFTDRQNVIANMGAEMAAEISRNAKLASINAEQDVAVRQNQLDLKRAELQSISDKAQAEADAVKGITAAEQSKTLKVKEQEAEIAAAEKKAVLEQKNAEIEEQKLNATTRWCQTDRYRKLSIQPNPKENWDGMDRVRDCWSGCEWAYPALERYYNPIRLLRDEYRRGGLPETFHYPIHTTKGEYRLAKGQISPHATILLNGKPVGLMFSDDCEEPFTDRIPPEWCATPLPENYKTTPLNRNIPVNGEFKPSFQQAMLGFVEWYEKTHKG